MKRMFLPVVVIATLLACNDAGTKTNIADSTGATLAKDGVIAVTPVDSATMMKACENYAQTGPMHQLMARDNGNWTDDMTVWMAPGTPPTKMSATSAISMILGGRYQQAKHSGNMGGMPFEGVSTTGYDNARKKFINTWIDNLGTGMIYLEGDYDSTSKTIHFAGKQTDPVTSKQVDIKQDVTFNADGTQTMTMYAPPMGGGAEFKTMEIVMKRK